jgi:4-carboxymuconolactone decarboxylase
MSLLPSLRREQLDEPGRALWDFVARTRGTEIINEEGTLSGPFNAWLYAPEVGASLAEVGAHLRFENSMEQRLVELAIITVGAHWKAEFEWFAHSRLALKYGVSEASVESIRRGRPFESDRDDERVIYAFTHSLITKGTINDALFQSAIDLVGSQGTVELVALCGYYCLVCFTLNSFQVPLPPGIEPQWP